MSPMGPNMDLTLRRRNIAGDDMWKAACKQPERYDDVLFIYLHNIFKKSNK